MASLNGIRKHANKVQDYVDACERLAQLNLTEVQQRDVIRVLVNCCGSVGANISLAWRVTDPDFSQRRRKNLTTHITHSSANISAELPTHIRSHFSFVFGISCVASESHPLVELKSSKI